MKNVFWGVESWNIILNFSTFSVRGCWGQPTSFFWKLVDETQNLIPPEAARNHKSIKLLILLPFRANLLCTLHYETPCKLPAYAMIIALMHQCTAHILSVCANVQVQNSVSTITIIELSATTAQWGKNISEVCLISYSLTILRKKKLLYSLIIIVKLVHK